MVSKEAEERRLRFLAAKEAAGGSFAGLMKQELAKKPKVYFLEDGTIVSITKEEIDVKDNWLCQEFSDEQLEILEGSNWNLFYIKKDPLVDNLFSIESRPLESMVVSAQNNSLVLIEYDVEQPDCVCSLSDKEFSVNLTESCLKKYESIDIENATANGHRILKFYFTAKNDPHFIIHSEYISISKLLNSKTLVIPVNEDLTQCSIYTVKAFDKYVRI